MKVNKAFIFLFVVFIVLVSVQTAHAQPPPPPPADTPPCWPPPCVPVNGGLIYAVGAAMIFGGLMIYRNLRLRTVGK